MQALPVDSVLGDIVAAVVKHRRVIVEAPPGAGKTTRVPPALLRAGLASDGKILVLQPRRIAARLAAQRVAEELGQRVGETVGYQVRFEQVAGERTRLHYITEGILTRRLIADGLLADVAVVILDEFHERHIATDVALAMSRRLQLGERSDLALIVMSATLDAEPVARYLGDAPRVRSEGRTFDVAVEHLAVPDDRPLHVQVERGVRRLLANPSDEGDILVFLPGAAEIRRAAAELSELAVARDLLVVPLHGEAPRAQQDRAVRPAPKRKVILSTNVAETSITIPGVTAVIDSGLARIAAVSRSRGLPTLRIGKVSRASATQRAGRAGRTAAGRAIRLYTKHDHDSRPAFATPEIQRLDLAQTVLELRASGAGDPRSLAWFEAPDPAALDAADALLGRLGALDGESCVTELGRRMLCFPVHPRLARLLVEAVDRGAAEDGAALAAILSERELRSGPPEAKSRGPSDVLDALDLLREARRLHFDADHLRGRQIDPVAAAAVARVGKKLERLVRAAPSRRVPRHADQDGPLLAAVLAAYPDRVAKRRRPGSSEVLLSSGGAAVLAESSVVRDAEMLVAVDVEERQRGGPLILMASAIEPDWLIDLYPERVKERTEVAWNTTAERVDCHSQLLYDSLVLHQSTVPGDPEEVERVLCSAALAKGARAFVDEEAFDRLMARMSLLARCMPEASIAAPGEDELRELLASLCCGRRSFAELREAGVLGEVTARLGPKVRLLERATPERLMLPSGRMARIEYAAEQSPWVASYLQEFFGMREGPRVCDGRVHVVLHLLAPNRRPVQVTTDLAGFWERHYPSIRNELARRYPKHAWPEDPLRAPPPRRR